MANGAVSSLSRRRPPVSRGTGHARTSSPMHNSVFPAKAGNQGGGNCAETCREALFTPIPTFPRQGELGFAKVTAENGPKHAPYSIRGEGASTIIRSPLVLASAYSPKAHPPASIPLTFMLAECHPSLAQLRPGLCCDLIDLLHLLRRKHPVARAEPAFHLFRTLGAYQRGS